MKTNKEIRNKSKLDLKGYWTMPVMATLVYILIYGAITGSSYLSKLFTGPIGNTITFTRFLISILVLWPLGYGFALAFLHFIREEKEDTVEKIFCGFKTYGRAIGLMALRTAMIGIWTLLLVVPGIIKSLAYAMSVFVSKDNPELAAMECLNRSEDLMKGHKGQLFLMYLGFFGMSLLCTVFTLGIGLLWYIPFMQTTMANFYEEVKRENEQGFNADEVEEENVEAVEETAGNDAVTEE